MRIKRFNEFVLEGAKNSFCIVNNDGKYVTAKFIAGKGNMPSWTDNTSFAYTYDTAEEAKTAAGQLEDMGFMSSGDYEIVPFKPTNEHGFDQYGEAYGFNKSEELTDADFAKALLKVKFLGERSAEVKIISSDEDIDNTKDSAIENAVEREDKTAVVEINSDYKVEISGDVREVSIASTNYYDIEYEKSSGDDVTPSTFDYESKLTGKTIDHIYVDGEEVDKDAELEGLVKRAVQPKK